MNAKKIVERLRKNSRQCQSGNEFALETFRGWRLQLTPPLPQEPKWHLSVSWRCSGMPDETPLNEILKLLGTDPSKEWIPPQETRAVIQSVLASVGLQRASSFRHYYWDDLSTVAVPQQEPK
jgi:hypothetical protein